MRINAFVQARMGSTRLPGKVLKTVLEKPLLEFLIERLRQSNEIHDIILLTSERKEDDVLENLCRRVAIQCYRGSELDVLDRFYQASQIYTSEGIVRITADCPLIDPHVIDSMIKIFRQNHPHLDYLSNCLERTFPHGLDAEIFTSKVLGQVYSKATLSYDREHVTPFIYHHPDQFRIRNVAHTPNLAFHRWTVDTAVDFELIQLILENLYPKNPEFRMQDILTLLAKNPAWNRINVPKKSFDFT